MSELYLEVFKSIKTIVINLITTLKNIRKN
jgi:hypothetical protein